MSVVRRFTTYVEFVVTHGTESLKVDLAQDSPFQLEPPTRTEAGIWVSSLPDLRVDKLLAYYGRAEPRDAVDLYFILQQAPFDELMAQGSTERPGVRSLLVCGGPQSSGRLPRRARTMASADAPTAQPVRTENAVSGVGTPIDGAGDVR